MKFLLLGLIALGSISTFAASEVVQDTVSEEQMLDLNEREILKLEPSSEKEVKLKKSLLAKIKLAKAGFNKWKRENPDHKEIRKEFKRISKNIQTEGTAENEALKHALERCKNDDQNCEASLKSNLESIYTNSEISKYAAKKSFSIIPSAYAAGAGIKTCGWGERAWYGENHSGGFQFFAGLFGADKACGLSFIGAGLGAVAIPSHVLICVGDGKGTNVGPYASVNGILGIGMGLTLGQGGVCQLLSFGLGVGAFAGFAIADDFGSREYRD